MTYSRFDGHLAGEDRAATIAPPARRRPAALARAPFEPQRQCWAESGPPPAALLPQAATRQEIAGRAARWPPDARVPRCEPLPKLLWPPAGMLTPSGADQLSDVI
ncbi:MAG: hypothetical protein H0T92_03460, partial [Pyrinomonadaceae bacterium]|nr:hypothetical protein [Pyrinomonadaceae bacterium]